MKKYYPVYHGRNHVIRVQDRTEVLISTDRCTMGTTLERDKSALDIYKLIIRSKNTEDDVKLLLSIKGNDRSEDNFGTFSLWREEFGVKANSVQLGLQAK